MPGIMPETSSVTATEWLERLQSNGYRLTAPRQAVVEIIASSQHVLSPLDVYEKAKAHYPKLGLVTVYRTVEKLEELGLIQRVHQPSGCHAFIAGFSGHEHLVICEKCGRAAYFKGDKIDSLLTSVESESGFKVHDHWLQLFGICDSCRNG
jgi:Fur family transcriptional regulator, ferric uptake regulator